MHWIEMEMRSYDTIARMYEEEMNRYMDALAQVDAEHITEFHEIDRRA